jgi:hypothetical protein
MPPAAWPKATRLLPPTEPDHCNRGGEVGRRTLEEHKGLSWPATRLLPPAEPDHCNRGGEVGRRTLEEHKGLSWPATRLLPPAEPDLALARATLANLE